MAGADTDSTLLYNGEAIQINGALAKARSGSGGALPRTCPVSRRRPVSQGTSRLAAKFFDKVEKPVSTALAECRRPHAVELEKGGPDKATGGRGRRTRAVRADAPFHRAVNRGGTNEKGRGGFASTPLPFYGL